MHVNHAVLREAELVVMGNVNLTALFRKIAEDRDREEAEEAQTATEVTPIKQKKS